jgi:hypothetical protein
MKYCMCIKGEREREKNYESNELDFYFEKKNPYLKKVYIILYYN